jgi:hypothetical protein
MKNITPGLKAGGTGSASGPARQNMQDKWSPPALIESPLTAPAIKPSLTSIEQKELTKLEAVIKAGWETFLEVGHALAEIRDKKLYRDKYKSIEDYCLIEIGYSRSYSYNLIGSAEVSEQLSSIEDMKIKPTNEAQCRELISVPESKRVDVWKKAIKLAGDKPVTAKIVHEVAAKFKPQKAGPRKTAKKPGSLNMQPALKLLGEIEDLADKEKMKKMMEKLAELRQWLEEWVGG